MKLHTIICALLLALGGDAAAAEAPSATGGSTATTSLFPRFIPRPGVQTTERGNLQLASVLARDGEPYPGTLFTVLHEEPDAYGKTRRSILASSGPHAQAHFSLAPGPYLVEARNGGVSVEQHVEVPATGALRLQLVLEAGELHLSSMMDDAGTPAEQTWFRVLRKDTDSFGRPVHVQVAGNGYSDNTSFLLPAGDYIAEASYGDAKAEQTVHIAAGGITQHQLILDAGELNLFSTLTHGGEQVAGAMFSIHRRYTGADGVEHWQEVTHAGPADAITFILPRGDYLARATLDQAQVEVPVSVEAAQTREFELPLEAGELVLRTELDGQPEPLLDAWFGVRRILPEDAGQGLETGVHSPQGKTRFILPAGRYRAEARVGEGSGAADVEIMAGTSRQQTLILDAGRVTLRLVPGEGLAPLPGTSFSVYRAEYDARGQEVRRRVFSTAYYAETDIVLAAGEYIAFARNEMHRGELRFAVGPGELKSLSIIAQR